jgi:serine/threonine protein kinase
MAMQEFCNGGSLRCAVNEGDFLPENTGHRWNLLISVLQGVASGMAYMHAKRLCHGDLNPANILLKVCLCDLTIISCAAVPQAHCPLCPLFLVPTNPEFLGRSAIP